MDLTRVPIIMTTPPNIPNAGVPAPAPDLQPRDSRSPPSARRRDSHDEPTTATEFTNLLDWCANYTDAFVKSHIWWHASLGAAVGTSFLLVFLSLPQLPKGGMFDSVRAWMIMFSPPDSEDDVRGTLNLVERAAAFVSAVAFLSFGVQMDGLISSRGVAPAADVIRRRKRAVQWDTATWSARRAAFHRLPNVFWFVGASDGALRGVCATGLSVSLVLTLAGGAWAASGVGVVLGSLAWAILYACHLSLIAVSGDFLGLQSDSNLCEVSILFSLLALLRAGAHETSSASAAIGVLRWLSARKMLGCGLCKFYGSPMWRAGTAMSVHHWTQPLPNPLSARAHRLPRLVHRASVVGTLIVEIVLPTLSLIPYQPLRLLACIGFTGLNAAINLTGNFGFIGALSVVESLSLIDDSLLPSALRFAAESADAADAAAPAGVWGLAASAAVAIVRMGVSVLLCAYVLASLPPLSQASRHTVDGPLALMAPAEYAYEKGRRYRMVNYYAKFASM